MSQGDPIEPRPRCRTPACSPGVRAICTRSSSPNSRHRWGVHSRSPYRPEKHDQKDLQVRQPRKNDIEGLLKSQRAPESKIVTEVRQALYSQAEDLMHDALRNDVEGEKRLLSCSDELAPALMRVMQQVPVYVLCASNSILTDSLSDFGFL